MNKVEKNQWILAYQNCATLEESQIVTNQLKDRGRYVGDLIERIK